MKKFDLYAHPMLGHQVVKQGFSVPAFFFTCIWAFLKKMWATGLAIIGVFLLLGLIHVMFEIEGSEGGVLLIYSLEVGFWILIGLRGDDWRRSNLTKRGFEHVRSVQAQTSDAALALAKGPPDTVGVS